MPGRGVAAHRGPRLGYTKSRNGCARCKLRRVKCDEVKPSCRACLRHGVICRYKSSGQTEASGSTPEPSSTRSGPGSGSGSRLGTAPLPGSGGTSFNFGLPIAPGTSFNFGPPIAPGLSPGSEFRPLATFTPATGSASDPVGSSGAAPAFGFGSSSGSGSGSGSGSAPVSGSSRNLLPVPTSGSYLSPPGSAGNPITPTSRLYSTSPAGVHQAVESGMHITNQNSRNFSFPASHGGINITPPTPNRQTPMAIQSLTNPPYPTPSADVSSSSSPDLYSTTRPAGQLPFPTILPPTILPRTSPHPSVGAPHNPVPQSRSRYPTLLRPSPMPIELSNVPATDPFRYLTQALTNPKSQFPSCPSNSELGPQLPNLELVYHYTANTYKSLTRGVHEDIWKVQVPKLAFSYPFLMHNLMSTAAFHLACTEQDDEKRQKWGTQGNRHFDLALRGMTEILRKEGVTPENCHAVFASSSLSFIGALCGKGPLFGPAYNREQEKMQAPMIDELLGVFILVRGIGSIVVAQEDILHQGPVGGLFDGEPCGEDHPSMDRLVHQLKGFYQRVASITTRRPGFFASPPNLEDARPPMSNIPKEHQIILGEITAMINSIKFALTKGGIPEQEIIAVWPITMSSDFMGLLQKPKVPQQQQQREPSQPSTSATGSFTSPPPGGRNPLALALLGYYCCVLKGTECECWFTKGWAEALIKEVTAELEELAGVIMNMTPGSGSGSGCGSTTPDVQEGDQDQDQTGVDRPVEVWREWVRREWLKDAQWARKWITTKAEEELPKPTLFSGNTMADAMHVMMDAEGQQPGEDAPVMVWELDTTQHQQPDADDLDPVMDTTSSQVQQPGADAPVMKTRDQQSDVPELAPAEPTSLDVLVAGAQGQQPGVPEAQAATGASEENVDTTATAEEPTRSSVEL
ncbi:hypothetical protein GE21DRAFT_9607 [Neurospora crassa]|uniref:Zn(2)-C6 fungal-type domain-containing protein n=1 Tax=Neurospora crassa (strain ATCC 24698 / 74-OR23-1A / CBS 708.71 / DSM 1257 / FGSC 987) TaxID=367110 RepID=A7UW19_NEUCR|nr:hypothetical protein NCU10597 [Neurospora crassa OR74A]EDO65360.2 hypothetical protein NCU10597 [Neurospora crassa OR74A]KHE80422.1 hypothetical protein GE21DRAFT_9607 [Neurospora crassa]|eukprot:XP_001728451.2 hypothetical protein NCU10597 [Neurospora crassa OR74A]